MPNRLIDETSPYLLQHANNPVEWYPWGEEALSRARDEDKPILLSIGYSACHWCHVMERESFENDAIAEIMNRHFVNIKVDREERPDLDAVYMEAVQMLTGSGGWPMTVFLTPDCKPFYGGTYFPPVDRHNMPGFPRLLETVAQAYRNSHSEIQRVTGQLTEQMGRTANMPRGAGALDESILHNAYNQLATNFDYQNGGVGSAPKFPQAMTLEILLRYYAHGHNDRARSMLDMTLEKMARGGIYDQIAGGFHRYSTDTYWLVPHFEKMLYDNALLARLYLHSWLATGRALYRRITEETLDYVLREMTGEHGGFFSATDADSEGEEGKFFVWSPGEIEAVLGSEEAALFNAFFGVSQRGNFEGKNILNISVKAADFAERQGIPLERLVDVINRGKEALRLAREEREHPLLDDKALASWNGLMLRALAEAGAALERQDYLDAAARNAAFLLEELRPEGKLLRSYREGQAKLPGFLEDHSFVADGLLSLYEATFDRRWLDSALELADEMISQFWDEPQGCFYDTGRIHEELVVRPRDVFDNAQPCGGSVASDMLLRLSVVTGNEDYAAKAVAPLRSLAELMGRAPAGTGRWIAALDFYLSTPKEVAVIGPPDDPATSSLLREVNGLYIANRVVVGASGQDSAAASGLPLLEGRGMVDGKPTAYVCENYACQLPVTDAESLAAQLAG
ncbi:MAG: thioredoxin domain-containing protein [Chloroflexi bacterium]|nr:thioredoxin domain-containing protein [Chloroflexota bacterium]MYE41575.1 thioredoxin domain-containing protein [Chloroflexota bacterium]